MSTEVLLNEFKEYSEHPYRVLSQYKQEGKKVIGVLPLAAQQKNVAYVPLPFLEAAEDYRDGRAVPLFGPEHAADGDQPPAERLYAGFRLYARSLDDVTPLRDFFQQQGITVHTEAEAIDQVRRLSTSLDIIFLLIGGAAAAGFTASTTSSTLAAVRRKQRLLGLLRLGGFSTLELLLFPLLQALLTAVLGTGLALGLYAAAQGVVNRIFAAATFALYAVLGKKQCARYSGVAVTCFSCLAASAEMIVLMLISHIPAVADALQAAGLPMFAAMPFFSGYTTGNLLNVLYICVFVTAGGYACYFMGMEATSAMQGSLVFFFKPVLAPILAMLILGEEIPWNMWAGIGLMLVASEVSMIPTWETLLSVRPFIIDRILHRQH